MARAETDRHHGTTRQATPALQKSSFAAVPAHLYTPSIPAPVASFLTRLMGHPVTQIPPVLSLKRALLAHGYRVAFLQAVIAILVNHIRRTLAPWLGSFLFHSPMEDLRLARSNPDVFLEQTLSFSWTRALSWYLQMCTFDVLAILMIRAVTTNNDYLPRSLSDRIRGSSKAVNVTLEGLMHLCRIGYGVYILVALDYVFCQSVNAVSCVIAVHRLLSDSPVGRRALAQVLLTHWIEVPFVALLLLQHIFRGLLPMLSGAVASALRGKPGLLLTLLGVAEGVMATIKWRAKLYILLEMSPMFVVLGSAVVAGGLLAREAVSEWMWLSIAANAAKLHATGSRELPSAAPERRSKFSAKGSPSVKADMVHNHDD